MTSSRHIRLCLALSLLTGLSFAQRAENQAESTNRPSTTANISVPPQFGQREPRYLLRPGDVFDLQFEFSPEFNQNVTVQPDGFVTLKGVGDVHVSGKTVPELTETLKTSYGKFLAQPVISIVLKDFEKPYVIANGMVEKPGKYELRGDTTVVEAIAIAGGLNHASAKHSQVLLFRRVSQEWVEAREIDVKAMLNGKSLREDVHLRPGDMIYVPQNRWSKVQKLIPYTAFNLSPGTL
jgi:polysaccharide export outer membrane protein